MGAVQVGAMCRRFNVEVPIGPWLRGAGRWRFRRHAMRSAERVVGLPARGAVRGRELSGLRNLGGCGAGQSVPARGALNVFFAG